MAAFDPEFLAIEPPELIGTGTAVSKARPELVRGSVMAASERGFRGMVLCGAGIVSGEDAQAAMRLGAQGILVAEQRRESKKRLGGEAPGTLFGAPCLNLAGTHPNRLRRMNPALETLK